MDTLFAKYYLRLSVTRSTCHSIGAHGFLLAFCFVLVESGVCNSKYQDPNVYSQLVLHHSLRNTIPSTPLFNVPFETYSFHHVNLCFTQLAVFGGILFLFALFVL